MLRVVVDPGVLVAARLSRRGAPAEVVLRWLAGEIDVIVWPHLLDELDEVLRRDKFRRYLTTADATAWVEFLREHATQVDDPAEHTDHTRDPDDEYLVALALVARADVLVSGDKDLIDLRASRPVVRTPRQLLNLLDRR